MLKKTEQINRKTTQNIFHAFDYAGFLGRPLNLYIVINLTTGDDELEATHVFSSIRSKFRNWNNYLNRKEAVSRPPAYIYTFENPDGMTHVNWCLNIEVERQPEFIQKLNRWVEQSKGELGAFDVVVKHVKPDTEKTLAKYVLKGTDPGFTQHFFLQDMASPQGPVYGRRATASPFISKGARHNDNYNPRTDRNRWRKSAITAIAA